MKYLNKPREPRPPALPVSRLNNKSQLAARLLALGYALEEVAGMVDMPVENLAVIRRSRLFVSEMDRARELYTEQFAKDAKQRLQGELVKSVETLVELRDGETAPPIVRRGCANDILDRGGLPRRVDVKENREVHIHLSSDEEEHLKNFENEIEVDFESANDEPRVAEAKDSSGA